MSFFAFIETQQMLKINIRKRAGHGKCENCITFLHTEVKSVECKQNTWETVEFIMGNLLVIVYSAIMELTSKNDVRNLHCLLATRFMHLFRLSLC